MMNIFYFKQIDEDGEYARFLKTYEESVESKSLGNTRADKQQKSLGGSRRQNCYIQ